MPPSTTTGSPDIVSSKFTMPTWSSPHPNRLDTPETPAIRSTRGLNFRGFTGLQLLRPVRLLASPRRIRLGYDPATGGFYVQASDGAVTLPIAGYDYDIDWTPLSAGLAPAGMAASFAALAWISTDGNSANTTAAKRFIRLKISIEFIIVYGALMRCF
jgi:hypothetical protein